MLTRGTIRFTRPDVSSPDQYDRHPALLYVDERRCGTLSLGESMDVVVEQGEHEVGVRLRFNFGTAKVRVSVTQAVPTIVRCEKTRPMGGLLRPSRYWRLATSPDSGSPT